MKQVTQFFGGWLAFWMLITFIGWFCNPGSDFRTMSSDVVVITISACCGWIVGICAVLSPSKWFEGEKP